MNFDTLLAHAKLIGLEAGYWDANNYLDDRWYGVKHPETGQTICTCDIYSGRFLALALIVECELEDIPEKLRYGLLRQAIEKNFAEDYQ